MLLEELDLARPPGVTGARKRQTQTGTGPGLSPRSPRGHFLQGIEHLCLVSQTLP